MSIKKVADIAGVSIATVSRYFNNPGMVRKETLDKVESAIKAINYQPNTLAKNFRRGRSGIIVVVVHNIGDPLYENLTKTITCTAQSKGYDILIKETGHNHLPLEYYRDMLNSKQVDGLIVMVDLPRLDRESQTALKDLPIVLVKGENTLDNDLGDHIGFDNYDAGATAAQHLVELGHQHIACLSKSERNTAYRKRKAGFIDTLKTFGLYRSDYIFNVPINTNNSEQTITQLLALTPLPTAIFCLDDDLAIDTLYIAKQQNIDIPQQLSIIGFNNIRYSINTAPPLTTIEQPIADIAQHSIEVLCAKMEGISSQSASHLDFKHRLIVRSSTTSPSS